MLGFLSFSKYHPFLVRTHFGYFKPWFGVIILHLFILGFLSFRGFGNYWVVHFAGLCRAVGTGGRVLVLSWILRIGVEGFWASLGLVFRFKIYVFFILLGGLDI